MFRFMLGLVIGYVLGAKAGRDRYEQIMRLASKARTNPAIQGAAGFVTAKVTSVLPGRKEPRRPDPAYFADDVEDAREL